MVEVELCGARSTFSRVKFPTWVGLLTVALACVLGTLGIDPAGAVVLPARTIDGPSEEIAGFGGVAMAEDGSGGVVYLKRVNGIIHVFVARYVHGQWLAPQQVDTQQPYAASWPRIGAANGGELVVVWATPFATVKGQPVEELLSSTLGPGASQFGPAIIVDPNIHEGLGTSPDLAMSPTGQADLVYRVIESDREISALRTGDVAEEVRVAHFGGERWTRLGAVNRSLAISMRPPTEANAPQIVIGPTGNGVVVWQEPEVSGVARIWSRRIFGRTLDYVMPVSATSYKGAQIQEDSDAPSVALSLLGQAEVVYRQPAGPGSPLPGPRIFLNILPDGESANGAEFEGASIVDSGVPGGKSASIGRPSIDIDAKQDLRILYDDDGAPRVIEGTDLGLTAALSFGEDPFAGSTVAPASELPAASVMDPEGGGVSAWPSQTPQHDPAVAVREDFSSGAVQTGLISGGAGGSIAALAVGRSSLGDGLVAFQQGPLGNAAIVASQITAPPATFIVNVPKGWIKPSQAQIAWEPAASANGPLTYSVILDGHRIAVPEGALGFTLSSGFGDGVHHIQVLAIDAYGQATLSAPSILKINGQPPAVKIQRALGGYGVNVRVSDSASGLDSSALRISFGDGTTLKGHARGTHRYARAGTYTVVVKARDKLGNTGTVRQPVHAL